MIRAVGCMAGVLAYAAARTACRIRNAGRRRLSLPAEVVRRFAPLFPALDLTRVRVCPGASLPPNWLGPRVFRADGITFGNEIFVVADDPFANRRALRLLLHELVHVDQVRRLGGERAFACAYGRGYVEGGSYRENPLEREAYEIERRHAGLLDVLARAP
jgi:hypothetical protein